MTIGIAPTEPTEDILSFAEENCSQSDLLLPLCDRVDPLALWFAARTGSDLVGVAAMSFTEDLARVGELCVDRTLRKRGIGTYILRELIRRARSAGRPKIMVTGVDLRDVSAKKFLESMGFHLHRDGVRMEWVPRPLPELEVPAGYEIRTYQDGDEEEWAECISRAYRTTPNPAEYTAQMVRENWTNTPYFIPDGCFFATRCRRIVGCFMAWREIQEGPNRGRLHWLAVDPDHRRRGIAKYLTVRVIKYLQAKGLTSIFLDTGYNLKTAMRMYRNLGFVETPRLFDYVRDLP